MRPLVAGVIEPGEATLKPDSTPVVEREHQPTHKNIPPTTYAAYRMCRDKNRAEIEGMCNKCLA